MFQPPLQQQQSPNSHHSFEVVIAKAFIWSPITYNVRISWIDIYQVKNCKSLEPTTHFKVFIVCMHN